MQAAIASCHATAAGPADTDWATIARLYTLLARLVPSPVVQLNRAVAVAMADGPAAGLRLLDALGPGRRWPATTCSRPPGPTCSAASASGTAPRPATVRRWPWRRPTPNAGTSPGGWPR